MKHLLIDIGNSTTVVAIAQNDGEIIYTWRFKTQKDATSSFFRNELTTGLRQNSMSTEQIKSVTISSVVPEVNDDISEAVISIVGYPPHFFSLADAKKVMDVQVDSPTQIGKDRLADAVGAVMTFGAPAIIFDMGTATTVGVVDDEGVFIGGMIIPGVKTSVNALSAKASQLPVINIEKPQHMVGRNTVECMQSGILFGTAAMIDGLIDRLLPMFSKPVSIIATGGMSSKIIPFCHHKVVVERYLQLRGLFAARQAKA